MAQPTKALNTLRGMLAGCRPNACSPRWPYFHDRDGYPMVLLDGRRRRVTHLALEWSGQPRPDPPNHLALHSCDAPGCFSPWHLRWGSNAENMQDRFARNGSSWQRGAAHWAAKLTEPDVLEIRARYARGGVSMRALAVQYGVCVMSVNDIIHHTTWRHVAGA